MTNSRSAVATALTLAAVFFGGCGNDNTQKPDKVYTNQEAANQIDEDLKRNMAEVDADAKLTPEQKASTKKMMEETVKKRSESFRQ